MVNTTPRPLFTPGKDPVPIVQEARWAPGPVWTGAEKLAPTKILSPDRPARSQSLYRLRYPANTSSRAPEIFSGSFRVYFRHNDHSDFLVVFLSPSRPYRDRTSNETRLQTIPSHILYKILDQRHCIGCYQQLCWPTTGTEYLTVIQGYLGLWLRGGKFSARWASRKLDMGKIDCATAF